MKQTLRSSEANVTDKHKCLNVTFAEGIQAGVVHCLSSVVMLFSNRCSRIFLISVFELRIVCAVEYGVTESILSHFLAASSTDSRNI